MPPRSADVVVTLDGVVRAPADALVGPADPMLTRGHGVFETTLVRAGRCCLLEAHLTRLAVSAAIVGLPAPDPVRWGAAVEIAVAQVTASEEAVLRMVLGPQVSFVTVTAVPDRVRTARRDGLAAITLDPGPRGPLVRAKSLSYAMNSAALREAQRRGAQDVIYVDEAGVVLEGPRSSVVIAEGETLVSPPPTLPILPGTTVAALFDAVPGCRYRALMISDLLAAQGVWLLSGVTLAARVHTLDGVRLAAAPSGRDIGGWVDTAIMR